MEDLLRKRPVVRWCSSIGLHNVRGLFAAPARRAPPHFRRFGPCVFPLARRRLTSSSTYETAMFPGHKESLRSLREIARKASALPASPDRLPSVKYRLYFSRSNPGDTSP